MPDQNEPKGASRNSALPVREEDPWNQNPMVMQLMKQADMPDSHGAPLRRYQEVSAHVSWGANDYDPGALEETARAIQALPIHPSLGVNLKILANLLNRSEDLLIRFLRGPGDRSVFIMAVDGLVDTDRLEKQVISPLLAAAERARTQVVQQPGPEPNGLPGSSANLLQWLETQGLAVASNTTFHSIGDGVATVLQGDALVLIDGFPEGILVSVRGWKERSLTEPTTEPAMRAPKEAFNESIRTMTALIRRRARTPLLRIERYLVGVQSPTPVDLLYIEGTTSPDLVLEARSRLTRVQVDSIYAAQMLEELIEDQPSAFFPQFVTTERPERVVAALYEGKIAFLIDGYQNAKIAPVSFTHFMPSPDDYEERFWYSTFILWVRYFFLGFVLFAPSLYVAVLSLHPDLLPTRMLVSLTANRLGIPYPTIIEVLLLELFFEGMREATALMPRTVGGAVTVVGGLVIGEGAISSGLASPATVVVVAITGVASFTIPVYSLTTGLRVIRFGYLILSATFGLYGLMIGLLVLILHLASLRSFGRPYLQPFAPFTTEEFWDTFIRAPYWLMTHRPKGNRPLNPRRRNPWLRPGPKY